MQGLTELLIEGFAGGIGLGVTVVYARSLLNGQLWAAEKILSKTVKQTLRDMKRAWRNFRHKRRQTTLPLFFM